MRKDFETQAEDNERSVADLRKKHAAVITELEEKVDSLQKAKSKYYSVSNNFKHTFLFYLFYRLEKERSSLSSDHDELATQLEDLQKSKSTLEKKLRAAEEQLADTSAKVLYTSTVVCTCANCIHVTVG